ncbi:NAD-dependent epimerase/dehydratase family protein [Flavobacterium lipolyticum]|uniref:NAD-dependent epimerase/dehydratase family protein n=1 Tax=Flavobacterium lipolyticum TaxID=2893754 RepID=A0ABS8LZ00_9FLAO|nr:NAD-dependent epimerase/dehydratase family protein [Flavobacterium sp. F-126]MCC9017153.1 NAD-dependent epimerase/dehydratase family protein [Flavobacterium sp. F-126]
MKIVISGASGFVGQNLVSYLSDYNFLIKTISLKNQEGEVKLESDAIIHLAGKAHDTKKTSDPSEYFKVNTDLTKKLFDSFLESEIKDFIYFSSVKAVADSVDDILYEDVLPLPKTPYGQSKLKAEEYILSKEIPASKRVFIIRPCMIHGPGNKGNLNLLYNVVEKGIPYPLAAFKNKRSFLSIDNLNYMIKEILENRNIASGVYNFADDEGVSTNDLVRIISLTLERNNRSISIPKPIINGIAKLGDIVNFPLNSETVQKLTENYRVSNEKIKSAIGIQKLPFSAEQGLQKTIKSFITK